VEHAQECLGCGVCESVCPTGALTVNRTVTVDPALCTGCGACVDECVQGVLSLKAR
jgi:ferredoxin